MSIVDSRPIQRMLLETRGNINENLNKIYYRLIKEYPCNPSLSFADEHIIIRSVYHNDSLKKEFDKLRKDLDIWLFRTRDARIGYHIRHRALMAWAMLRRR